jgi:hypothetical protein
MVFVYPDAETYCNKFNVSSLHFLVENSRQTYSMQDTTLAHIAPNPNRLVATLKPRQSLALLAAFSGFALAIMWWRWGGTIEDSLHYFNTARYLRGEISAELLRAPFPYRLLVPAIAAALPGDVRQDFALLNWLLISGAAYMIALSAVKLGYSFKHALLAGLLLVVSVPTFWYAPYLLVDPGSICSRAAFVLAVVSGQPWLAVIAALLGTAVREENILLLVWLVASRRLAWGVGLAALAMAGAWLLVVRWWIISGLPSYTWTPSFGTVLAAMRDVRSLASIVLGAGVVLPLALAGMRHATAQLRPIRSLLVLMALPPLYAALCVRVDGRAIWGLYPFLIPFVLSSSWLPAFMAPRTDRAVA